MSIDIGQRVLSLSPELRIQALKGCFQTQVWLVMYPSRIWTEMKDRHLIMDTELMNYRIIKVEGTSEGFWSCAMIRAHPAQWLYPVWKLCQGFIKSF